LKAGFTGCEVVHLQRECLGKAEGKSYDMPTYAFILNDRLGIRLPGLSHEWEEYTEQQQHLILAEWEEIRGRIPSRIIEIEQVIIRKQLQLNNEENFAESCKLNWDISELASQINDLHLWYRVNQEVHGKIHQ
jgi:hypothetical protein